MKKLKLSKKSILISIVSLCLIIGVVGLVTTAIADKKNNPYGVKVTKLPTSIKGFKMGWAPSDLIDSNAELNQALKGTYDSEKEDANYDDLLNSNFYDKYDDDFFESNVLYYASYARSYDGSIFNYPYIDIKNCYYSAEKNSILIKANITSKIKHVWRDTDEVQPLKYKPRGYVIEFPREMFDDNNLDYTDFMIFYLNYEDEKYFYEGSSYWEKNVQIGLNKYGRASDMHKDEPDLDYDSIVDRG